MQILQTFANDHYVFRSKNMTLTIAFNIVDDAKFYGYDLLNKSFIESIFKNK